MNSWWPGWELVLGQRLVVDFLAVIGHEVFKTQIRVELQATDLGSRTGEDRGVGAPGPAAPGHAS